MDSVVIKSNKHGVSLKLDSETPFDDLKNRVREKFTKNAAFFGNADMAIEFTGKDLSDDEMQTLIEVIEESCNVNIIGIVDNSEEANQKFLSIYNEALAMKLASQPAENAYTAENEQLSQDAYPAEANASLTEYEVASEDQPLPDSNRTQMGMKPEYADQIVVNAMESTDFKDAYFYNGTLRSGQLIDSRSSVIVIGDVNPGGQIITEGNVIVLGNLRGNVFAGCSGNDSCFVAALQMNPMQIQISQYIGRSDDSEQVTKKHAFRKAKKENTVMPKIAYIEDESIIIDDLIAEEN